MKTITLENIETYILTLRGEKVIIDKDVAKIYAIETKRVNEAVKNNPDKFPKGYIYETSDEEFEYLRSKFSTAKFAKDRKNPKAFTEKGLYMLATIIKSDIATKATINIIETFTKVRELSRHVNALVSIKDKKEQKNLMQKSGDIIAQILENEADEEETSIELNLAVLKSKHIRNKEKISF